MTDTRKLRKADQSWRRIEVILNVGALLFAIAALAGSAYVYMLVTR